MRVIVATYRARPGEENRIAGAMSEMVRRSRAEEGCVTYLFHQSRDDPQEFLIYEQYVSEEAFEAHKASDHFRDIVLGTVVPLLESRVVKFYDLMA